MKTYMVKHRVICEVNVWRTIEAETFAAAMRQVSATKYITCTDDATSEIVNDIAVKSVTITEQGE